MAKEKVVNYTPEMTAELVKAYTAEPTAETVAHFAEKFGKGVRSIVAKLSREGVYKAKEYTTKTGEKPIKKDEHADAIGRILRLSEPDVESLTKANKRALMAIVSALANSVPIEAETPEEIAGKGETLAALSSAFGLSAEDAASLARVRGSVLAKIAAAAI